ncbi:MAG TPA: thiamine pyrophosphate-dependent dehydrogenase E1 component subunit alpha [Stellaceae bacterium]|nr:thiamine pyrophosphate-dependent dehydrogenase E1 component subunit alpha [Stellaceae bacterium]
MSFPSEPPSNAKHRRRALALFRTMARIRAFEQTAVAALRRGEIPGVVHPSIGQEAVAAAICANLDPHDYITSTHRGHGHALAKGADAVAMMAELLGRATGTCGGKGGSMHIADFSVGMLGANGVVAGGIPIAVGAAQGLRLLGKPAAVVCFFGDGAVNRGPFLEGLNWAALFGLPVLFVCEDNGYAAFTATGSATAGPGAAARAEAIGVPALSIDGNDALALDEAAARLIAELRAGAGPRFLHARTYRLEGHTATDKALYRDAEEVAARRQRDPLAALAAALNALDVGAAELEQIARDAEREMQQALDQAAAAPLPPPEALLTDVQDLGAPRWHA